MQIHRGMFPKPEQPLDRLWLEWCLFHEFETVLVFNAYKKHSLNYWNLRHYVNVGFVYDYGVACPFDWLKLNKDGLTSEQIDDVYNFVGCWVNHVNKEFKKIFQNP